MKNRNFFVIIALVAILSSILTVSGIRFFELNRDNFTEVTDALIEEYNSHSITQLDNEARACGFTGIGSIEFGSLELNRCYVNGTHVSAEDYNEYVENQMTLHQVLFDQAQSMIQEQSDRLDNITIRDWFNAKFDR